jgi:hypothetical protein
MNFYLQKFLHNQHEVNVYHILELNIIRYSYTLFHLPKQLECVQIVIIHKYSYENMLVMDQKSEFILGYKQKFLHSKQLHEELQIDDQLVAPIS